MKGVRGKRGILLTAPLVYFSPAYKDYITAPTGTFSNFGSIPAIVPPALVPRVGKLKDAFVLHDYLYQENGEDGKWSKLKSDLILYDALGDLNVWWWRRVLVLAAVTLNLPALYRWNN